MDIVKNLNDDITTTLNHLSKDYYRNSNPVKRGIISTQFNIAFKNLLAIKHELNKELTTKLFNDIEKRLNDIDSAFYELNHCAFSIDYKTLDAFKYVKKDNKRFVLYSNKVLNKKAVKDAKSKSPINLTQTELGAVDVAMSREWVNQLLGCSDVSNSNAKAVASAYHKITGRNIKHITKLLLNIINF